MPRSRATWRADTRRERPFIVARTMLCGLVDPRLLVRMSVIPAHSSTARTGPPAITPVPLAAGLRRTRPAPCSPTISWGIVEPVRGSSTMPRLAASTALRTASDTSFAFPVAMPTRPRPSPTATSALNENRRPPFTTLATRLIEMTFSTMSLPCSRSRSRREPRSPRPRSPPRPRPRPRGASAAGRSGAAVSVPSVVACCSSAMLELQSAFARAVCDGLHATVIPIAGAVEHDPRDPRRLGPLRQQLPGRLALRDLAGALDLDPLAPVVHAEERDAAVVVHQLGRDVLERAEDHEPRPLGRPVQGLPDPQVAAVPPVGPRLRGMNRSHDYFAPVLPALRRTCSPWYRTPLPL